MEKISVINLIETAIKAEDIGIQFYSKLSRRFVRNNQLKMVLERMAKQKIEHKRFFTETLNRVRHNSYSISDLDRRYFESIDLAKFFDDIEVVGDHTKPLAVLTKAFAFEKESILFYQSLRDILGKSSEFDEIIDFCKLHMNLFLEYVEPMDESRIIAE